jgi:alkylation response protein AidB-like acyl-CoA dehydrogenase
MHNFRTEAHRLVDRWQAGEELDQDAFWEDLRQTSLPFISILLRGAPSRAFSWSARVLYEVGRLNLGAAYALENHLYVLGGFETYLTLYSNRTLKERLDDVLNRRQFVANTHTYVHTGRAFTEGMSARKTDDGVELIGVAHFMSFASRADQIFVTLDGREPISLLFPARESEGLVFGKPYFPRLLIESDTRPFRCDKVRIPARYLLDIPRDHLRSGGPLAALQLGWHLVLLASAFLGAAGYLIDVTLTFVRNFKSIDDRPLARLDNVISEMGQMRIRHGVAEALIDDYATGLAELSRTADPAACLAHCTLKAQTANHFTSELVEDIARRCRRLVGTRSFGRDYARFEKIMAEIVAAPLSPRSNPILEKDVGHAFLAQEKFDGGSWPR